MKKYTVPILKSLSFVVIWITLISIISAVPSTDTPPKIFGENESMQRLWWELVPCVMTLLLTLFFTRVVEKGKVTVSVFKNPAKNILMGMIFGIVWIVIPSLVLYSDGIIRFDGIKHVSHLVIWFLAALLNVIMQEYLVRGYLFQLLRKRTNLITAIIVTTLIFTAMHGGAFEAGTIAVMNVITMSVFMTLLLLYCESLLAPIIAHFIWNAVGCMILGVVSLAEDYPSWLICRFYGSRMLTGGTAKIEGSIVILFVNLLFVTVLYFLLKRKTKKQYTI